MLDVHPPHSRLEGVKDFLLHLFTITIGLLIALALEGCAERVHHHHMRDEADEQIRQEIRDNMQGLASVRNAVATEQKSLVSIMQYLQARAEDKPHEITGLPLSLTSSTLGDASWKTATATGALTYMTYTRAQQFASTYQEQELFTRLQFQTIDNYLQLQSYVGIGFDPKTFPAADAKMALMDVRAALAHLTAMNQVAADLQSSYQATLDKSER